MIPSFLFLLLIITTPPTKITELVCLLKLFVQFILKNTFSAIRWYKTKVDNNWNDFIHDDLHVLRWDVSVMNHY